jgi:hypothetical protein
MVRTLLLALSIAAAAADPARSAATQDLCQGSGVGSARSPTAGR